MRSTLLIASVLAIAAGAAHADISTAFVPIDELDVGGTIYYAWEMWVTTDTDWTNAHLHILLTQGSLVYDAPPGFCLAAPELCPPPLTRVMPPNLVGPAVATDTEFRASWFTTVNDGSGTYTVAQIVMTHDAEGSLSGKVYDVETAGMGVAIGPEYSVIQSGMIPEPAVLGLLAFGGLILLRHKRRR